MEEIKETSKVHLRVPTNNLMDPQLVGLIVKFEQISDFTHSIMIGLTNFFKYFTYNCLEPEDNFSTVFTDLEKQSAITANAIDHDQPELLQSSIKWQRKVQ